MDEDPKENLENAVRREIEWQTLPDAIADAENEQGWEK